MPYKKPPTAVHKKLASGFRNTADAEEALDQNTPTPTPIAELRRAVANPRSATPEAILGLQASYGNQAVQRLLARSARGELQRGFLSDFNKNLRAVFAKKKKREVMADLNGEQRIDALIADQAGNRLFTNYCKVELSTENINAYKFIIEYDKTGRPFQQAQEFQTRFMLRSSEEELNVPAIVSKTFSQLMEQGKPGEYLTTKVKEAIMVNLLDTFARFEVTVPYKQWLNSAAVSSGAAI